MAWSLSLDEVEQYRHDGCLLVQSVLGDEDRRTLIFAYRAGDAYPLFYGLRTTLDEARPTLVRGRRARRARFGGPAPIVPIVDDLTVSLYDIQADGRPPAPTL